MAFKIHNPRGFTLIELMIVVAIIGILAAIAIPINANVQTWRRIAQAEHDSKVFLTAVERFRKETGRLPSDLGELTRPVNTEKKTVEPVLERLPEPPRAWTYTYYLDPAKETLAIVAKGDGKILKFPK